MNSCTFFFFFEFQLFHIYYFIGWFNKIIYPEHGKKKRLIQFNEIFHRKLTIIRFYRLIIIILKYNNPSDTYSITNDNRNNEKR